jgi:quercetin dioxygenase-like cupin family protein
MLLKTLAIFMVTVFCVFSVSAQNERSETSITHSFLSQSLQWVPCPEFIPKGCEIAVLHGDPAKPNADVFFKVPPNFTIPWHKHTSAERMILVSGTMRVTFEGEEPATLKPGMYAYGPAGKAHTAFCEKGDPCVLFIAFESPVDAIPKEKPSEKP